MQNYIPFSASLSLGFVPQFDCFPQVCLLTHTSQCVASLKQYNEHHPPPLALVPIIGVCVPDKLLYIIEPLVHRINESVKRGLQPVESGVHQI